MITPPYSSEAEIAVISSALEDYTCLGKIGFLNPSDFFLRPHRLMYELILDEYQKGNVVDVPLIGMKVTDDMGGIAYFAETAKTKASVANVTAYARQLVELSIRRKSIEVYKNAAESLYDAKVDYVSEIAEASNEIDKSLSRLSLGDALSVDQLIDKSVSEMEKSLSEMRLGISTGIEEIDCRLGYQKLAVGEITYLGAQSKNGKTLFGNTIAARCDLSKDECCHIFSVEMPAIAMFNGVVSAISGVPSNFYARQSYYSKMMPNKYDEWMGKWGKSAQELNESGRITIDDRKDVTMAYICAEMRKQHQLMMNKGKELKLVIIDHLHRISFDTKDKAMTYAMGDDVRMLKNTASDLGIAVLLLGQLNENCKDRNPTAFDILDTSRVRHEIQAFIGTRIFRQEGGTYFGIYSDAHRYADHDTQFGVGYMKMIGGVVKSLEEGEYFTPEVEK